MKVTKEEKINIKKAFASIRTMALANDENEETKLLLDNITSLMMELNRLLECISDDTKNLTREEAIAILRTNPTAKVSHVLFSEDEFLIGNGGGTVFDENDYVFEDWTSSNHNGIRMRNDSYFKTGWYLKTKKDDTDEN